MPQIRIYLLLMIIMLLFNSCSTKRTTPYIRTVNNAILFASPEGKRVLKTAHKMAYDKSVVVRGSCWNYINAIYKKAGFQGVKKNQIIFKGKKRGYYASQNMIQRGDWIYYINHSYYNVEHSGIFVAWMNYSKKKALILSYKGSGRVPGRYKIYDLSSVYRIKRGKL